VGRDSSVGIADRCGLDGPGFESQWRWDFPQPSRPVMGPTQPPVQWVPGLFPGVNRLGRGADRPPIARRLKKSRSTHLFPPLSLRGGELYLYRYHYVGGCLCSGVLLCAIDGVRIVFCLFCGESVNYSQQSARTSGVRCERWVQCQGSHGLWTLWPITETYVCSWNVIITTGIGICLLSPFPQRIWDICSGISTRNYTWAEF
jgi:hypothetical protein